MQINFPTHYKTLSQQSFEGYFACPVKEIHMHPAAEVDGVAQELQQKCSNCFDIILQTDNEIVNLCKQKSGSYINKELKPWSQDYKVFLEEGVIGSLFLHAEHALLKLSEFLKLDYKHISQNFPGGNFFIGKKNDGETFMLLGEKSLFSKSIRTISKDFKIKKENILTIPQSDFHIDMTVRPLDFPDVLVADEDMLLEVLSKEPAVIKNKKLQNEIQKMYKQRKIYQNKERYKNTETIINELELHGFNVIRTPGILGENNLNFMNAVVHQNPDGSLIYITGGSTLFEKYGLNLNKIFEKELKKAAPQIKDVIFVDCKDKTKETVVEAGIKEIHGGLHCMCCERPDFELWSKLINKKQLA